jgi:outer membrane protein TolC
MIWPFVTLGSNASLNKLSNETPQGQDLSTLFRPNSSSVFPNPLPDFLVSANLSWQIDIWRQLRNARDAQRLRYLGTVDGRNYVVTRVVATIAENYYTLMALDKQFENLDFTIKVQEQSLELAKARKQAARDTELAVQRFQAEVYRNQSQKRIIRQDIVEAENRINFLAGRYPQPVDRANLDFLDLKLYPLAVGVPSQLLQNRPDIRRAERELQAAGLDIRVARANFYPRVMITAGMGYDSFNAKYLFMTPTTLIYNVAGNLTAPLINRSAIKADYFNANARQLQALYDYQQTILEAFTEVVNQVSKVKNYGESIELKKQQLQALNTAVDVAGNLFQNARVEYVDVLFAQRDRNEARMVLIDTKKAELQAIVDAYQALGGGWQNQSRGTPLPGEGEVLPPAELIPTPAPDEALPPAPNEVPIAPPVPAAPAAPAAPAPAASLDGDNPSEVTPTIVS